MLVWLLVERIFPFLAKMLTATKGDDQRVEATFWVGGWIV